MKRCSKCTRASPAKFQQEMGRFWKKAGVNAAQRLAWPIFIPGRSHRLLQRCSEKPSTPPPRLLRGEGSLAAGYGRCTSSASHWCDSSAHRASWAVTCAAEISSPRRAARFAAGDDLMFMRSSSFFMCLQLASALASTGTERHAGPALIDLQLHGWNQVFGWSQMIEREARSEAVAHEDEDERHEHHHLPLRSVRRSAGELHLHSMVTAVERERIDRHPCDAEEVTDRIRLRDPSPTRSRGGGVRRLFRACCKSR